MARRPHGVAPGGLVVGRKYSGTEVSHRHSFDAHVRLIPTTLLTIHSHAIYKSNKLALSPSARPLGTTYSYACRWCARSRPTNLTRNATSVECVQPVSKEGRGGDGRERNVRGGRNGNGRLGKEERASAVMAILKKHDTNVVLGANPVEGTRASDSVQGWVWKPTPWRKLAPPILN
jgi:hypothetical protein